MTHIKHIHTQRGEEGSDNDKKLSMCKGYACAKQKFPLLRLYFDLSFNDVITFNSSASSSVCQQKMTIRQKTMSNRTEHSHSQWQWQQQQHQIKVVIPPSEWCVCTAEIIQMIYTDNWHQKYHVNEFVEICKENDELRHAANVKNKPQFNAWQLENNNFSYTIKINPTTIGTTRFYISLFTFHSHQSQPIVRW